MAQARIVPAERARDAVTQTERHTHTLKLGNYGKVVKLNPNLSFAH